MKRRLGTTAALLGTLLARPLGASAAPAFNHLPAPVDVSVGVAATWVDVDVSAYVPRGATGVLVLVRNSTGGERAYGLRKNGSTDPWETETSIVDGQQTWLMTGLDGNRVLEIYAEDTGLEFHLYAYTMRGVRFFTNRIDKSVAPSAWSDVDLTADASGNSPIGAVFTVLNRSASAERFALRKKGSIDDRYSALEKNSAILGLIGVDGTAKAEMRVESGLVDLYLVGYVTHGAFFFTNAIDKSTATTGAYQDVDITADVAGNRVNGAIVELHSANDSAYPTALRRNGSTEDFYLDETHGFASVGVDATNRFEQKIGDPQRDLYLVGYSLDPPVWYRSVGTGPDYTAGTLTATAGSPTVTGSGVFWLSANRGIGDRILIGGADYIILSVDSETQLTLAEPVASSYSGPYTISRQFATLQAWESCIDGSGFCPFFPVASSSLVADDRVEVGVAYNDSPFTSVLEIKGSVTDGAHSITLTVAPGNRHRGVAGTGVRLDHTVNNNPGILIEDDFVSVTWFEITGGTGSSEGIHLNNVSTDNQIVLRHNIIHDVPEDGLKISDTRLRLDFADNIVHGAQRSGIRFDAKPAEALIVNNTVFRSGSRGFERDPGTGTLLKNNISHSNVGADYDAGTIHPASSHNMSGDDPGLSHSPGGSGINATLAAVNFVSTAPGAEDLHIVSGSVAADTGTDLPGILVVDIDGVERVSPWDIGADDIVAGASPKLSSAFAQSFTVSDPDTAAAVLTITDNADAATITAVKDLRIRIPAGFNMRWDVTVPSVSLGGTAGTKVATAIKRYEDLGRTVVLEVTSDFAPGDILMVDGLEFASFTAPSPPDHLELDVANDGLTAAIDDKTIAIVPRGTPAISSLDHQLFTIGPGPLPAEPIFVSEGLTAAINDTDDIRIHIPGALDMEWNTGILSIVVGGNASSKVSTTVMYPGPKTLVVDVTSPFAPGDYISISGVEFANFGTASSGSLVLEVDNMATIVAVDDKVITIDDASDVPYFTATATNNQVKLEWVNPYFGACDNTYVVRNTTKPTGPLDGVSIDFRSCVGLQGQKQDVIDATALNDTKYDYAIFVEYGGGLFTAGRFLRARPFNSLPGPVKWAYATGAASMAPPGLRFFAGEAYVYAVSNDGILHAVNGGPSGGDWPAMWKPFDLGAPAQARPPVVSFAVGSAADGAAFVGSQNGFVYAIDAVSGTKEWSRSIASMVQAAPAGHFRFYDLANGKDVILVGTRNASSGNTLEALDVHTGAPVWSFDNSSAYGGDDKEIGIISGGASVDYGTRRAFFASRAKSGGSANTVWCVEFDSGAPDLIWAKSYGDVDGSPILLGSTVYVGTNAGVVYALDAANGDVLWSLPLGDGAVKSFIFPQFGSSNLIASTNANIWSIDDTTGTVNSGWPVTVVDVLSPSTPLFVPGSTMVVVGSGDGSVHQMDVVTPTPTTSVVLGDGSAAVGAPTMDLMNSMIYVGSDEGVIYAIEFPF